MAEDQIRQLLSQIQSQHATATKSAQLVKSQVQSRERESRMLELTLREVGSLEKDTNVYRSVGKMFMLEPLPSLISSFEKEKKDIESDIAGLQKKNKYLENEITQANNAFREVLHQQQQQQ